jgi:hypothetical protein
MNNLIIKKVGESHAWGGFHKKWAYGVKNRAHPNLGEKAYVERKAQMHDAKLE